MFQNTGPFFFGCGSGRVSDAEYARVLAIAEKHDAYFVRVRLPDNGPRYWFETRNYGDPFNGATARAVLDEVGEVRTVEPARARAGR